MLRAYIATVGHHESGRPAGKRPEGGWYSLRPRLSFKHTAEHGQGLHIPEPAIMSQPAAKEKGEDNPSEGKVGITGTSRAGSILPLRLVGWLILPRKPLPGTGVPTDPMV